MTSEQDAPAETSDTIDDVMARVAADIAKIGVGKTGIAAKEQGAYPYRKIVDVLNVIGPIMAAHGLSNTVEFKDRQAERVTTRSGALMTFVVILGVFTYRWRGETRTTITIGEGFDTDVKATNKAMSAAAKYAHGLTFNIPFVGMEDAEAASGTKTLNDTKDKSEPSGMMSSEELSAWIAAIKATTTKTELRAVTKDSFAKATEHGDTTAHDNLRAAALEHSKGLPA